MRDPDNTREEIAHAGYISACAEIVSLALFIAMVWIWFGVIATEPVR